jgi:quercetin dioxygenase-like cupin family protein
MRIAKSLLAAALVIAGTAASAQVKGVSRSDLSRHDLSNPGHEAIQVRVTLQPRAEAPRHSHPGEEIVYVLSGSLVYHLDGQAPSRLRQGVVLFIPAGVVHSVRNPGPGPATELATYLVTKGQPLLIPAE